MFEALLKNVGVLVAASFVMGLVFERVGPGYARGALIGLTGGLFSALCIVVATPMASGMIFDGRTAIMLVTGLFGGPVGAAVSIPLPVAVRVLEGGPTMIWGVGGIVIAALTGLAIHHFWKAREEPMRRNLVVLLAVVSPVPLTAMLLPHGPLDAGVASRAFFTLLIWLPAATLVFGLLVANEHMRSVHSRSVKRETALLSYFGGVSAQVFEQQLEQQHRMYARYGCLYCVLLIAVDPPRGDRERPLGGAAAERRQRELARTIKASVRECDIVAVRDDAHCVVLLPFVSEAAARPVAQRIQENVAQMFAQDADPLTISIGIAEASKASSASEVFVIAEGALFIAGANAEREVIGPPRVEDEPNADAPRSFPGVMPPEQAPVREALRLPTGVIRLPTTGVLADPGDGVGERVPPGDLVPARHGETRRRNVA